MELLERLKEAHVDVEHSLERFCGNEALYLRFIQKFPQDPNFGLLADALKASDYQNALTYAHTLKGVSANLGIDELSGVCAELVAKFRAQETEGIDILSERLALCYQTTIQAING